MPEFQQTPSRLIRAVHITVVDTERSHILCKACFCTEYEIEEDSIGHATAHPQDDLLVEKFEALTSGGRCPRCQKAY